MPGTNRTLCENSGGKAAEIREGYGEKFALCGTCGRVLKPRRDGTLRDHSVRGKNTASSDKTMSSLFAGSTPIEQAAI